MPDRGAKYADNKIAYIDRKLRQTYRQAQQELTKKLKDFNRKFKAEDKKKKQQLANGEITEKDYKNWLARNVFQQEIWETKVKQVEQVMYHHNRYAMQIVNESKFDVFAENYYSEAFKAQWIVQGISFEVYNTQAIQELLVNDPKILPEWEIDKKKDYIWNEKKVQNIITQGIIQGDGVEQITKKLCNDLSTKNENRMRLFARTAMTGAQNAGRQVQMGQAADIGIDIHKRWEAVHDNRTRDTHRAMDGEEVNYDKPFSNGLMHPGDPSGAPGEVYNCRCTMVSIYPKYEDRSKKYGENVTIDGKTFDEWQEEARHRIEEKEKRAEEKRKLEEAKKNGVEKAPYRKKTLQMYDEALGWQEDIYKSKMEELRTGWANVPSQIEAFDEFEKSIPQFEQDLKTAINNNDFSSMANGESILHILRDGRMKSQIETGTSGGYLDADKRKRAAEQLFAGSEQLDLKDDEYEIYGMLGNAPRAKMYGNCRIVLNKDSIIDRTTITVGDSLELIETGADPIGTLAKDPKIYSYGDVFGSAVPNAKENLENAKRDFASIRENGYMSDGNYVELQFHGGVTLENIEYIEVPKSLYVSDDIQSLAKEKGVRIKWLK